MDFASQGKKALADRNAHLAVELFTRALIDHPTSPHFYTQRAIAYLRLKSDDGGPDYLASLKNAQIAEHLAKQRGSYELLLAAQMRRAIALFHLEFYSDANALLEDIEKRIKKRDENDPPIHPECEASGGPMPVGGERAAPDPAFIKHGSIAMEVPVWKMKTAKKLQELSKEDLKSSASVLELQNKEFVPDKKYLQAELEAWLSKKSAEPAAGQSQKVSQPSATTKASSTSVKESSAAQADSASKTSMAPTEQPIEKVRHDWYQTANEVIVSLYVKKIPADKVESEISEKTLSVQFPLPSGATYDFSVDPLYAPVNASNCKVKVMGTKIEITLAKESTGLKWHALENTRSDLVLLPPRTEAPKDEKPKKTKDESSKATKIAKGYDGNDSDASDDSGDPVDSFFKSLYAKADPDTRRAMMKSYVESNGTALSTNWSDVGTKKVEAYPPKD